jgi:hypothetical protein
MLGDEDDILLLGILKSSLPCSCYARSFLLRKLLVKSVCLARVPRHRLLDDLLPLFFSYLIVVILYLVYVCVQVAEIVHDLGVEFKSRPQ